MDIKRLRLILFVALAFVLATLWGRWQQQNAPKKAQVTQSEVSQPFTANNTTIKTSDVPDFSPKTASASGSMPSSSQQLIQGKVIQINTDLLHVNVSLNGGDIVGTKLLKYPAELHSKEPVTLLTDKPGQEYVLKSGVLAKPLGNKPLQYSATQQNYELASGQDQVQVKLVAQQSGLQVVKTYTFYRGKYQVGVSYQLHNNTSTPINARVYGQILRVPPGKNGNFLASYATYNGAAISTPDEHYQKVKFKAMKERNLDTTGKGGWAAMIQHYFISAWVPESSQENRYYSRVYGNQTYAIGAASPAIQVPAGGVSTYQASAYIGPAIAKDLNAVSPHLSLSIDYGWLWFISILIFKVMNWIHHYIGNWGWSIVLVTLLIKLIFYPLSAKSYRSMAKMRQLQPKIKAIKERYADDRAALGKATMELYQKEKVNPLGGCLPILIQIPVFIGLYYMLMASVELRQAPWILWIHDLSVHDPYYVLPIIMGGSMLLQQFLNPPVPDPTQAKIMKMIPIVFTILFLSFPAGLVLYWVVNNSVSILQQWYTLKKVEKEAQTKKRNQR